jgi:hypothetical protein
MPTTSVLASTPTFVSTVDVAEEHEMLFRKSLAGRKLLDEKMTAFERT